MEVVTVVPCQQHSSPAVDWTYTLVLTYLLNLSRVSSPSYTLVTASAGGLNHARVDVDPASSGASTPRESSARGRAPQGANGHVPGAGRA